jgi:S-DNA-T family DNA segregation ATPase FtsK/SpoIIIE
MGADKLLGNGDMLFLWPGTSTLLRGQGTYLGDDEINKIVDCVSQGEQNFVKELVNMKVETPGAEPGKLPKRDELYESAVDMVVREGRGSVSLLQRGLGIGYGRAARLIDFMAEDGIVGTYAGSQAREVLISLGDWERMQGNEPPAESEATVEKPRRSHKIVPEPQDEDEDFAPPKLHAVAVSKKVVRPHDDDDVLEEDEEDGDPPFDIEERIEDDEPEDDFDDDDCEVAEDDAELDEEDSDDDELFHEQQERRRSKSGTA